MADDLNTPLSPKGRRRGGNPVRHGLRHLPIARTALAALIVIVAIVGYRIMFVTDPQGGRPSADVPITSSAGPGDLADSVSATNAGQVQQDAAAGSDAAAPTAGGTSPGPSITVVGDAPSSDATGDQTSAPAPSSPPVRDDKQLARALTEETPHGAIPRISNSGETPFSAYAQASISPASAGGTPLVAIVVSGLGLNESSTISAIGDLPPAVTLGFAPYGKTLRSTVPAARSAGHEVLLEVPLEPFDYPQSDPGPQTLLTNQPPKANLDRLYWLMARFGGYFGVMNYMGARFTSSAADFEPIMEELGMRGLGYFDDGSSNRSLAPQMADANHVPYARASVDIDNVPSRTRILAALSSLEEEARKNGSAIGVASALPVTISAIAEWSRSLEEKGIELVPVSALMSKP